MFNCRRASRIDVVDSDAFERAFVTSRDRSHRLSRNARCRDAGRETAVNFSVSPSRKTSRSSFVPGDRELDLQLELVGVITGCPLTATMTSPSLRPACAAGELGHNVGDQSALVALQAERFSKCRRDVLAANAEVSTNDLAVFHQAVSDLRHHIGRHSESHALEAATAAENGGIDADEATIDVDERAAGVPGIDRGIGLDKVLVTLDIGKDPDVTALRTDDAARDRFTDTKGIADGEHAVAHFDLGGVGKGDGRKVFPRRL